MFNYGNCDVGDLDNEYNGGESIVDVYHDVYDNINFDCKGQL